MPICNNPSQSPASAGGNNEINDHASEAAKVKRVKEQAYFNSYNFDAIEELPYDVDEDEDDKTKSDCSQHNYHQSHQQQKQHQLQSNQLHNQHHPSFNGNVSPLLNVSTTTTTVTIPTTTNVKSQSRYTQHNHSRRLQSFGASSSCSNSSILSRYPNFDREDKYCKKNVEVFRGSSGISENSYKSLIKSFPQEEVIIKSDKQTNEIGSKSNNNKNNHYGRTRGGGGRRLLVENYTIRPSAGVNIKRELIDANGNAVNTHIDSGINGGTAISDCVLSHVTSENNENFLLPRAMLKYQSSVDVASSSMPLAMISTNNNNGGRSAKCVQNLIANKLMKSQLQQQKFTDNKYHSATKTTTKCNTIQNNKNNYKNNSHTLLNKCKVNIKSANNNSNLNISSTPQLLAATTTITSPTQPEALVLVVNNLAAGGAYSTDTVATSLPLHCYKKKSASSSSSSSLVSGSSSAGGITNGEIMMIVKCSNTSGSSDSGGGGGVGGSSYVGVCSPGTETASSTATTATKRGDRASSQSHYSTDKSGSSGYYSSNVCSTYSVDDHIYSEPAIDVLDLNCAKSEVVTPSQPTTATIITKQSKKSKQKYFRQPNETVHRVGKSKRGDPTITNGNDYVGKCDENKASHENFQNYHQMTNNLRVLETSIENLDRHLKSYPRLTSYTQANVSVTNSQAYCFPTNNHDHYSSEQIVTIDKMHYFNNLPTIIEGHDSTGSTSATAISNREKNDPASSNWRDEIIDDTLLDIDLDSFLSKNKTKVDANSDDDSLEQMPTTVAVGNNRSFDKKKILQDENHYKCAKYINSCPEDAYHVESDIDGGRESSHKSLSRTESAITTAVKNNFFQSCEDRLHFQNTRDLLEDVREKIRLLSQDNSNTNGSAISRNSKNLESLESYDENSKLPKELEYMIKALRSELESYLERLNQNSSELEIRQLCTGLVKNQHIVKMKKAFERRKSIVSSSCDSEYDLTYEAVRDGMIVPPTTTTSARIGVPIDKNNFNRQYYSISSSSIRCLSDPNFKMKRKSLNEVFPLSDCYTDSTIDKSSNLVTTIVPNSQHLVANSTQLQKNLSFHKPILTKLDATVGNTNTTGDNVDPGASGDKETPPDWHKKRPSIWEMYYGTNRLNQSLLGKRTLIENSNQVTMSYPSSRPETDFTLDLPRAEQLRIKMEKEKKFRQRCRYITSFLSLFFFLLTVMVVSLVLTRGKRMFGSML